MPKKMDADVYRVSAYAPCPLSTFVAFQQESEEGLHIKKVTGSEENHLEGDSNSCANPIWENNIAIFKS